VSSNSILRGGTPVSARIVSMSFFDSCRADRFIQRPTRRARSRRFLDERFDARRRCQPGWLIPVALGGSARLSGSAASLTFGPVRST
jgi:hypothetical protein